MTIQWFPGHMTKARRLIEEELKLVDVILEVVDARIPNVSRNPLLNEILGKKRPRLVIMNKEDLADRNATFQWIEKYTKKNQKAIAINSQSGSKKIKKIINDEIFLLGEEKRKKYLIKGAQKVSIRAMIVGIPNVGKSTLINTLIGKSSATTGNKPGVTRGKQWLKLSDSVELLDTPGLLWTKFESQEIGLKLALTGAIADDIFPYVDVAYYLLEFLMRKYPENLVKRYGLYSLDMTDNPWDIYAMIGKNRGALLRGGKIDESKVSKLIIKDFRLGKLGRITLE